MTRLLVLKPLPKAGFLLAGAFALAVSSEGPASAADYTMKFSTPTINELQHEWMRRYKDLVEERSEGRIEVELYPASQLGPINSVLEGLQLGSIEATITPAEFYVGVDSRLQLPAIPGLFDSWEDANAKLTNPEVRDYLLNLPVERGIQGIGMVIYGPQTIATRNSIDSLEDLSGQRLRVLASETEIGTIDAIGAAAVPMPLNEVQAALQQGAIDGVSTGLDIFISLNTHEVAPYVTTTELWYLVSLASVSTAWLETLPEDLQEIVIQAGLDLEEEMFEYQFQRDQENVVTWQDRGGSIGPLSDEDQQFAEEAAREVAEQFVENNPQLQEGYDLIMGAGSN